jgi:putative flavoprotein involved in K+ transport
VTADPVDQDHIETIVIGGGQTGLTIGYELARHGREFVILDGSRTIGDAWRKRWDSLLLFTPARYNGLPGMPFPGRRDEFVGKDAVADYLQAYARFHELPVRSGAWVKRVGHDGERFTVDLGDRVLHADNVVVAMADYQVPKVPAFGPDLDPDIVQLHSSQYKNPSQLQEGAVLVVGMGNSGADIGLEVARTHQTYIAGKESAHIPFRIEPWTGRRMLPLVRFVMVNVLNTSTPIGRKVRPKALVEAAPLIRVKPKDLEKVSERVGRVTGVVDGKPVLDDERALDVANVIWCTGFSPGFSWIDLPVKDDAGRPRHERGIVADLPGLYFCGLGFLHALWSETLTGVGRDARYVVDHLVSREAHTTPAASRS